MARGIRHPASQGLEHPHISVTSHWRGWRHLPLSTRESLPQAPAPHPHPQKQNGPSHGSPAHVRDPSGSLKPKKRESDLEEMRAGAGKENSLGEKAQALGEKSPRPLEKVGETF